MGFPLWRPRRRASVASGKTFAYTAAETSNRRNLMNAVKVIAIVLIIAGALGLVYQQFSFTRQTTQAKLGPLELSVKEKETVNVPLWVSLGAIGVGVLLLVTGRKK